MSFLTTYAVCQDLAVIRGEFANVTEEKSDSSDILCQLEPLDIFSVDSTVGNWSAITKPTDGKPIRGFLPKPRIHQLKEMSNVEKRHLIKSVYDIELANVKSENYDARKDHHEPRFDYLLNFASRFIVETKDSELLTTFIETIKLDDGSADETPSWSLGWIFLQEPDWTIAHLHKVGIDELLAAKLEFGFDNVVYKKESTTPGYQQLKAKLAALK